MFRQALAGLACATALTAPAIAQTFETETGSVTLVPVVEGLQSPWGMVFLPDESMLVTERPGNLRHVSADGSISDPIAGIPEVVFEGQGGLLDVALDPEFETNRYVYLSYAEPGDEAGTNSTAVARGVLSDDMTQLTDVEVIFSQQPKLPSALHFGSRLTFDNEGYLFITTGERSDAEFRVQAQDLDSHLGKVIRILPDGSVPEDNPFVDTEGALPEIWSYGHRNMQGAAFHPDTGELWVAEHGPRGGDELNRIVEGGNFGWPLLTEGTEYSGDPINPPQELPDDLVEAERTWVPSPAPSGLAFYTGDLFPDWQGDAFMGALAGTDLIRIDLEGEEVLGDEFLFGDDFPHRIRDVTQGPDDALYLITDADPGQILRLSPAQ
ncbi:PQQ-dependent sugar dehydrogenase [Pelagibacterium halotolerans]|uniref:PQQ-dependent oxidoreductase, gdhB family n=1 Tax=Pelagibacterium halotolerans (strain DSM 22347 / JCM 15775 / CGMCC 1.7692 / B2) TaxID=1082931 RepID=G4RE42_PELHB|nr:PQQ-dependent sugar dehydrogenase [Pelagibacterium halotolerans]AEQ50836.1 PQQ-dependent oxidoreductase, gdhB family [Pelagibacterium halotolerans B2]QJR19250.1 PQQ-dependent sugar dehydrogenase [Pelagibacterium halotolerans]SDZ97481.1 Glucose/arabinose dehydrogenase, beta-propeller fold [Pelagibacterium halotolerans]